MNPRNDTVREFVVDKLEAIATSSLGMDSAESVHDYLLENEIHSKRSNYLRAVVGGQRVTRALGVRVLSEDVPYSSGNIYRRTFTTRVELYYPGDPEGFNLMVDHSVLIREALEADQTLGGQVDLFSGFSAFTSTQESFGVDNKEGKIYVGVLELVTSTRKIQIQ